MSDWARGYRAHDADLRVLAASRGLLTRELQWLLDDVMHDASVIEHELDNRLQRQRLRAQREVQLDMDLHHD